MTESPFDWERLADEDDPEVLAEPVFDAAFFEDLRMPGDETTGFLRELAEIFERTVGARLATLRAAVEAGEAGKVVSLAHAIKGTAGGIGARRLMRLAQSVEYVAHEREGAPPVVMVERMEAEFRSAVGLIGSHLARMER